MKHLKFILFLLVAAVCFSCSTDEILMPDQSTDSGIASDTHHISQKEALAIANRILHKDTELSRSIDHTPDFEYVLNEPKSRAESTLPDTLAYVINYPDNNGFAIISSENSIFPILAFSESGQFTFENEISKVNFIDCIGKYLAENKDSGSEGTGGISKWPITPVDSFITPFFEGVKPFVRFRMDQRAPFNKYVDIEHPGCPVGCVAVASALVMSHSKSEFEYYGTKYYFNSILDALDRHDNSVEVTTDPTAPMYTYEQATDYMSKLVYYLGKDLNMSYSTSGSGAFSSDAYNLIYNLGFEISTNFASYNAINVAKYLLDNNIIYVRGSGHAWVIDGCKSAIFPFTDSKNNFTLDDPKLVYVHCDWGWGGYCNGYYAGDVFKLAPPETTSFTPSNYFAVKLETNNEL